MTHFFDDDLRGVGVNRLVDGGHHPEGHQFFDDLGAFFRHPVGQFLYGDDFGNDHFLDDLFLRLNDRCRFRLLFLETAAGRGIAVIVVVIVAAAEGVDVHFRVAALRFKAAFGDFFAFLFKDFFFAFAFFRRRTGFFGAVVFVVLVIKVKTPAFLFLALEVAFVFRLFRPAFFFFRCLTRLFRLFFFQALFFLAAFLFFQLF